MPELWPNVSSGRRSAGSPALHSREVVRRTRWPPPHREPQHAWLGILEKRPQETGLTFLWFPCPGTVFSHAGALVSLWRHLLSMCIFAMYVLPVSAVDGRRKGMSEGQCKQRGEQGVFPQPVAQRSHLGDDARALLVLWPFSVRSKSKAPQQSHSHAFAGDPNFGCSRTNCCTAIRLGAEPSLCRGRVFPSCGKRPRRSGRALGGKPDKALAPPSHVEKHP